MSKRTSKSKMDVRKPRTKKMKRLMMNQLNKSRLILMKRRLLLRRTTRYRTIMNKKRSLVIPKCSISYQVIP
jgi:hypothetical protein